MLQRKLISFCVLLLILVHGSIASFAQVNLPTGGAIFSLPIFNWQDDKSRLTSTIALGYSSGNGLKVNDVASNEGQGWSMVAGGVITRIQANQPDDQQEYAGYYPSWNDQDLTKIPAGILYGSIPVIQGCPVWLTKYPTYGSQNELYAQHNDVAQDRELDRFVFQFNGKSGEFVIDTTGGVWHGVPLGDSKMQISLQVDPTLINYGIRTTITSFTITDVDGLIYKFTRHGLTKLLTTEFSNGDGSKPAAEPKIASGHVYCQSAFDEGPNGTGSTPWINTNIAYPYIISNWYLSEVDDPFTTRKITFAYDSLSLNNSAGQDISYNAGTDNYVLISYKKSISTVLEIASITYPDGHVASFNYSPTSRFDYPGEKALSSISVQYTYEGTTRYLSQYLLNTSYFILNRYGTPSTPYEQQVSRLCLRSVQQIGVDLKEASPPYQFDYYTTTGSGKSDDFVPPTFCYSKDIWGYYNGNNSLAYSTSASVPLNQANPYASLTFDQLEGLCFLHSGASVPYYNANPGYAENGLLKTITYPTGGSLTYKYAQDTGTFINSSTAMAVGGVHVAQAISSDGGYSNGCNTPVVTQYNYVMNGVGSASSLWGLESSVNSVNSNNYWKEEKQTIHFSFSSGLGCKWHYVYPGILTQYAAVSLDEFQHIMNAIAPVLGMLSILSTIDDVLNVISAVGFWTVVPIILDIITYVLGFVLSCPQQTKNTTNTVYYNYDLNLVSPLPVQFKRVEITESPGTIGKTVEQFTQGDPGAAGGPDYYALWFAAGTNTAFSIKQRFAPWAYGLPYMITQYDVNGNMIKQTQNLYDFSHAQEELLNYGPCTSPFEQAFSYKCEVLNNRSLRADNWASQVQYDATSNYLTAIDQWEPGTNGDMIADEYDTYTGRVNLTNTYQRTYRTTDATQFVQTETDYYYNQGWFGNGCNQKNFNTQVYSSNYDLDSMVSKGSNGDLNTKRFWYPFSYNFGLAGNNSGILQNLVNANIVSMPVVTQMTVNKAGSGAYYFLNEKVTEFTQLANNDIKPSRSLEQRFATPEPAPNFIAYPGPTAANYTNYKIPDVFTYDVNANMVGIMDEGNRNIANIYAYNDKYIVASVINANAVTDKPAYTSFEDTALSRSGWTLSGSLSINYNSPSETGNNNFTLQASGANSLSASSLNTATAYICSFWASNSNVTVTGGTLVKSAPTYNGFTYYEYNIPAGTSSVTVKSGSAAVNIDELRLYPSGARMRTTTYDPLIGKTSECDENNRITYYTYDNLARLQFIEDETHNIVKMYEYNNVSQAKQTACPGSFSSPAINEQVTRNNCGAGYQGGSVPYTISAGQFTSTISQFDADIQAEIYLLTNQQTYANTNGACSLIYYNVAESQPDTTQTCAEGYAGGVVTYTVPAGTYSSIISQTDANNQALADIAANAQMYANRPGNAVCTITDSADWEWNPGDSVTPEGPYYCAVVNGTPHQIIGLTDLNPNSSTYGQTKWEDNGPSSQCPAGSYTLSVVASNSSTETITLVYENLFSGVNYTFNVTPGSSNVTEGTIPIGPYTVTMTPTTYSSSYPLIYTMNPGSTQTYYAEVAFGNVLMTGSTCTVTVSPAATASVIVDNNFSEPVVLSFVNTSTGTTSNYEVALGGSLIITLVQGTYNVTLNPVSNPSGTTLKYFVNSVLQTSTGQVEFTNVAITSSLGIDIDPAEQ